MSNLMYDTSCILALRALLDGENIVILANDGIHLYFPNLSGIGLLAIRESLVSYGLSCTMLTGRLHC